MSCDALVLGSGPNGLAAGIELAAAGWRVLVLEAAERAGGAVASEELTLPGFRHDTFSSVYPAGAASPVFAAMALERHGLRWVHPQACLAHTLGEGRAVALYRDLDRTAAGLESLQPGDGEAWRRFAAPLLAHFEQLSATMLAGFPPLGAAAGLLTRAGPGPTLGLGRLLFQSAQSFGERLFEGDGARAWLYGSALHSDVPPSRRGSAIAAAYLSLLGHGAGWPSPAGGAGALADALVGRLRELGGEVRTGARVTRVLAAGGRLSGVQLSGGERVAAAVAVADLTPRALARLGEGLLGARYERALLRYRYGPPTLKLDWALSGPIPWEAPEAREAGTVHLGGGAGEVLASSAAWELPRRPFMLLGQQSLADPSRAPAGAHTAWAYTRGWRIPRGAAECAPHVQRMEEQVERFAPGFRELILARHVLAPEDLERRDANLLGGDVGNGSYGIRQLLFRPVISPAPYRTPLRGLYLGSAAAFPGAGVHGVPGAAAARLALADHGGLAPVAAARPSSAAAAARAAEL
jgi:phytoene dehydrogenase-like protein